MGIAAVDHQAASRRFVFVFNIILCGLASVAVYLSSGISAFRFPPHSIIVANGKSGGGNSRRCWHTIIVYCYNKVQLHFLCRSAVVPPFFMPHSIASHLLPHAQVRLSMRVLLLSSLSLSHLSLSRWCPWWPWIHGSLHLISPSCSHGCSSTMSTILPSEKCLPCTPVFAQDPEETATWPSKSNANGSGIMVMGDAGDAEDARH